MTVRLADPGRDAELCAAVYAPAVLDGFASFEVDAPDSAEMARRIAAAHVWLVHSEGGYAYAGPHKARPAYRWACDVAVYVHPDAQRRGIGRGLYAELFPRLAGLGLRWALAGVSLPNPGSVRLHESFGFEPVGVYREIGFKAGAWRDVGWWQLELAAPGADPPAEPRV